MSPPSSDVTEAAASVEDDAPAPADAVAPQVRKPSPWNFLRTLRVRIGAEQLQLEVLEGRGNSRRLAGLTQASTDAQGAMRAAPTDLVQAAATLAPALAALAAQWKSLGGRSLRGMRCEIVIDDSWMLYDVVRADLRGLSPNAADSLINASLADVAGVDASELMSRWQAQGESPYTVACGMPAGTMPVLLEALAAHGIELVCVEGEFIAAVNRYRDKLEPACAVIAVVRDAGAQLGVMIDGVLRAMSFEYGVGNPKELETRGRGLLRAVGLGAPEPIRYYAISAAGEAAPEPWIGLAAT